MPAAVKLGDTSTHGGTIVGPGITTVLIGGSPACVMGDMHTCPLPVESGHVPSSPFTSGSGTVMIGGVPALRTTDVCACGAGAAVGEPTVMIG